jgi:hypothetical protein
MAGMCRGTAMVWIVTGFFSAAKPHVHSRSVQQSLFIELPLYPYWIQLGWVCHAGSELWLDRVDWRSEVIGVDEANFMGASLVDVAQRLADSGKQVIVAGLDADYLGRPFVPIPDLLALAESITKTLAICVRCGNPAKHTQRLRAAPRI